MSTPDQYSTTTSKAKVDSENHDSGRYRVKSHTVTFAGIGPLKSIPGAFGRGNALAPRAATVFAANAVAAAPAPAPASNTINTTQMAIRTFPTPRLRLSKLNYRPDKTKKDVVISSTGIIRNASRFVDTISNGKNKYVDTKEFAPGKYKVAAAVQDMESSEREEFWVKNHVEIQIPIAALVRPNGGDEINRIVRHMDNLGEVFTNHLENMFINMSFPTDSTHDSSINIFEVQSIKALQPLVEKLKTFKNLKFTCVNIITRNSGDTPCLWEWLQYAAPFGYLPYKWHLYWIPGFQQGRIRINPGTANYRYVNEQSNEYCRQHEAYLSSPQTVLPEVFQQQLVHRAKDADN